MDEAWRLFYEASSFFSVRPELCEQSLKSKSRGTPYVCMCSSDVDALACPYDPFHVDALAGFSSGSIDCGYQDL